jgi:transposase
MGTRRKYDYEFRLRCVEAVLKGEGSVNSVSKENGTNESELRLWLKFFDAYGEPGLRSGANRRYDEVFKLQVLKAIEEEYLSLRECKYPENTDSLEGYSF